VQSRHYRVQKGPESRTKRHTIIMARVPALPEARLVRMPRSMVLAAGHLDAARELRDGQVGLAPR
jgi:hypothetical protein